MPPRLPSQALLFDLDGTLVHTSPDLAEGVRRMLRELGRPAVERGVVEGWIGQGVARLVKRALTGEREAEPDAALFERAYALFLEHYGRCLSRESRPYPGARETLRSLREARIPLACITSKLERFTLPLLRDLHLDGFFRVVVAGDSLPRRKPDPLPVLHACAELGAEPAGSVFVGDSITDAHTARAAGTAFVAVRYGYHGEHPPETLGADLLVDSLEELLPELDGTGTQSAPRTE